MSKRMFILLAALLVGALAVPAHAAPQTPGLGDQDGDSITDLVECTPPDPAALGNGEFDQPDVPDGGYGYIPESQMPAWQTTAADHIIEIWDQDWPGTAIGKVPAHGPRQFVEINGFS